jgi:argininosuccinate lyase
MNKKDNQQNQNQKLWAGRSAEATDRLLDKFNSSFYFDFRLWKEDIAGSLAHAQMLSDCKIITQADYSSIKSGLETIYKQIEADTEGWFKANASAEDIHMAIEAKLTELIGEPGRKLHTARSRNDQVATDIRLWLKKENHKVRELLITLLERLTNLAERDEQVIMPGYTHLQKAQPISLGHHWLAHFERFSRDLERLSEIYKRLNVNPLGSGALAGTTYPIDRESTTKILGFGKTSNNSLDSVSDRDFIAEHQFASSMTMLHLSQLSEELIVWSSEEFAYIYLDDKFATGSSMMPQKKNPDIPELIRGKSGRVLGNLQAILTTIKGLPLAYNKDLQEDKEGLFDTLDNLRICLEIMDPFLASLKTNQQKMENAVTKSFCNATDAADYLVKKGKAFREAYSAVGKAVRLCLEKNCFLSDLPLTDWKSFDTAFEQDIFEAIDMRACLENRKSKGGTSPTKVREEIPIARESIKHHQNQISRERDNKT